MTVKVTVLEEWITLHALDGTLQMPDVLFEFEA